MSAAEGMGAALPFDATELAALSPADRSLLTRETIARWTDGLGPDDAVSAMQLVRLERRRRATLTTLREGLVLTDTEFRLWRLLQRHEGRTVLYTEIIRHLWPDEVRGVREEHLWDRGHWFDRYARLISRHVGNLKVKLEIDPKRPQHIVSERGIGYRWYSAAPSRTDGEDYGARADEARVMRYEIRGYRGELPPPRDEMGRFGPGPEHPDYQAIEGDVVERSSRSQRR